MTVAKKKSEKRCPPRKKAGVRRDLSEQQKRFVAEYLNDFNATQAALRAKYSKRTAYSQGQRLLKNVEVQKLLAKKSAKLVEKVDMNAEKLLRKAVQYLEINIAHFLEFDGRGNPYFDLQKPAREQLGMLDSIEISEGKYGRRIKMSLPKGKEMLELIGRHISVQAFGNKLELTGKGGGPVVWQMEEMRPYDPARYGKPVPEDDDSDGGS